MKLNVLLYSYDWLPLVGGIQSVTADLAQGLCEWSSTHNDDEVSVTLMTETPCDGMDDSRLAFPVIRRPRLLDLIGHIRSADVVHIANPTLVPLALAYFLRKPTVVEHHGYQSICPNGLLLYGPDTSVCSGHFMARQYGKCFECNTARMGRFSTWRKHPLYFPKTLAVQARYRERRSQRPRRPKTFASSHTDDLPRNQGHQRGGGIID